MPRSRWRSRAEFLLATTGYAVGLSNVWRFPYVCFSNGGGAFLLPYMVAMIVIGIPLYLMELSVGQLLQRGPVHGWAKLHPCLSGLGACSLFFTAGVAIYYQVILAWAIYYGVASLQSPLPWAGGARAYFEETVLQKSSGLTDWGGFSWPLAAGLAAAWAITYFSVWKGVRSTGRVVWLSVLLPYILLVALFMRGVTLPGALDGIKFLLTPRFSALLDINVWAVAAEQIFYSLGPGTGCLVAFASYNRRKDNIERAAVLVPVLNCLTSVFASIVMFCIVGYMAEQQGTTVEALSDVIQGTSLTFIAFPTAAMLLPGANVWAVLFFVMLLLLGVDSTFSMIEPMTATLEDCGVRIRRELLAAALCVPLFLAGLPLVTGAGQWWLQLLDGYLPMFALTAGTAAECIGVAWLYGVDRFAADVGAATGRTPGALWRLCWRWLNPALLLAFFVSSVVTAVRGQVMPSYPQWSAVVGPLLATLPLAPFVLGVVNWLRRRDAPQKLLLAEEGAAGEDSESSGEGQQHGRQEAVELQRLT